MKQKNNSQLKREMMMKEATASAELSQGGAYTVSLKHNSQDKDQEERFLEWAEARDDDWWDNGTGAISIWDFRIMQDFIKEELSSREKEIEGLKKTENFQEDQSVSDEVYYEQQQNIGYNQAIDDVLKIIKK